MMMDSLEIPGSYQSYLETFEENPELAIQRLGNRVEKRKAEAVGYFLLSWLYFRNGDTEKALENAFQAKVRAPGSQLIGRLHYYISHPDHFYAWVPDQDSTILSTVHPWESTSLIIQDLDQLILKRSTCKINGIRLDEFDWDKLSPDLRGPSSVVVDI